MQVDQEEPQADEQQQQTAAENKAESEEMEVRATLASCLFSAHCFGWGAVLLMAQFLCKML